MSLEGTRENVTAAIVVFLIVYWMQPQSEPIYIYAIRLVVYAALGVNIYIVLTTAASTSPHYLALLLLFAAVLMLEKLWVHLKLLRIERFYLLLLVGPIMATSIAIVLLIHIGPYSTWLFLPQALHLLWSLFLVYYTWQYYSSSSSTNAKCAATATVTTEGRRAKQQVTMTKGSIGVGSVSGKSAIVGNRGSPKIGSSNN